MIKTRRANRTVTPRTTPATSDSTSAAVGVSQKTRMDVPQPTAPNYDQRVRETLMVYLGQQGDPLDRGITLRDLVATGVIVLAPGYTWDSAQGGQGLDPGASGSVKPDLTPPPDVTGTKLTPGLANFYIETDEPTFPVGHGYLRTHVYGVPRAPNAPQPTFNNAIEITTFSGTITSYATSPSTEWHVWLKWETNDGVMSISPAGGTNGYVVTTGSDVDKLVTAMTGEGKPFQIVTVPITLPDGTVVPAGTYTADAYIKNGSLVNAKIQDATIRDAKIVSLGVVKLTAGNIAVDQWIKTSNYAIGGQNSQGFYLHSNGYAEFQTIVARGTIYADAGYFKGSLSAATGTFNGDISAASGTFPGGVRGGNFINYNWPANGGQGFYLGVGGLRMGSPANGAYFEYDWNTGVFRMPGLTITSSGATFTGTINIDNGTGTKLVITNSLIEVFQNGTRRVRMGVW